MHKMSGTIYGIGIGDAASDTRMARITHHFANFTYWRDKMSTTQYNVACKLKCAAWLEYGQVMNNL